MMKHYFRIFLVLFFAGTILSCEYEQIKPIVVEVESASFATDVFPLFSSCAACHPSSKPSFDATSLEKAYTTLTSNNLVTAPSASSVLMTKVNSGHNGYIDYSAEDKAKIAKWIDDGALNN
jgi:hypothetical protein